MLLNDEIHNLIIAQTNRIVQCSYQEYTKMKEVTTMTNIIDRDTYRKIKKMSREELQAFLMRYAEGLSSQNIIDLKAMETDIKSVKGIGEKRTEEIMQIVERHLGV